MKAIQYKPVSKRRSSLNMPKVKAIKLEKPVEAMGPIMGRMPQSVNEWYMARALWAHKFTFEFQVPIHGGRSTRGGQVLDFLVDTVPIRTALRVQGEYWHRNKDLEQLKANDIARYIGEPVRLVDAFGKDTNTYENAYRFVDIQIGRA